MLVKLWIESLVMLAINDSLHYFLITVNSNATINIYYCQHTDYKNLVLEIIQEKRAS